MRLQQSFFWWIAISAVLPLTLLMLGLTIYGEWLYREQIRREIHVSLNNISAGIKRSLSDDRSIALQIANSSAMHRYLPVLQAVGRGGSPPADFSSETERVSRFLLSFNDITRGQGILRVLDLRGNTLIKVRLGRISPPSFDGVEDIPYAEPERGPDIAGFAQKLGELKPGEVNYMRLFDPEVEQTLPDGVVPLAVGGEHAGYLTTSLTGQQLDYILQLAPRPYHGRISLIEINHDMPERHGRILYDDDQSLLFSAPGGLTRFVPDSLLGAVQDYPDGEIREGQKTVYFSEIFPYPDRLLSWLIGIWVDDSEINEPFQHLRYGILLFALVTLLLSLFVAHIGAARIARPVSQLVKNFRAMSRGEQAMALHAQDTQEIAELSAAFNDMQKNLNLIQDERDRAKDMAMQNAKLAGVGQLAAGIGHELNNPLNNVISYARLIEKDIAAGKPANNSDVVAIREECERASVIIRGILNFSRQVPVNYTQFNVRAWLLQTRTLVLSAAEKRKVGINIECTNDFTVCGDSGRLQQALINLLMNAVQASKAGTTVEVAVEEVEDNYRLGIFNAGQGIADDAMEHLFEPFFTTKMIGEGSGLGLSIALGIIEQHHGALQLQNMADESGMVIGVMASMVIPVNPRAVREESRA